MLAYFVRPDQILTRTEYFVTNHRVTYFAILVAPRFQPFRTNKGFCEVILALESLTCTVTESCSFVEVNPF